MTESRISPPLPRDQITVWLGECESKLRVLNVGQWRDSLAELDARVLASSLEAGQPPEIRGRLVGRVRAVAVLSSIFSSIEQLTKESHAKESPRGGAAIMEQHYAHQLVDLYGRLQSVRECLLRFVIAERALGAALVLDAGVAELCELMAASLVRLGRLSGFHEILDQISQTVNRGALDSERIRFEDSLRSV